MIKNLLILSFFCAFVASLEFPKSVQQIAEVNRETCKDICK